MLIGTGTSTCCGLMHHEVLPKIYDEVTPNSVLRQMKFNVQWPLLEPVDLDVDHRLMEKGKKLVFLNVRQSQLRSFELMPNTLHALL